MTIKNLMKNNPWSIGLLLWVLGLIGVVLDYKDIIPDDYFYITSLLVVLGWMGITIGVYLDAKIRRIEHAWSPTFFTFITVGIGLFFYLLLIRATEKTRETFFQISGIFILGIAGGGLLVEGIVGRQTGQIVMGLIFLIILALILKGSTGVLKR